MTTLQNIGSGFLLVWSVVAIVTAVVLVAVDIAHR
jgi:hypothetical protein